MQENADCSLTEYVARKYSDKPTRQLYHYTSLDGIVGINRDEALWATNVQYFNDASELRHATEMFDRKIGELIGNDLGPQELLGQLRDWLKWVFHSSSAPLFAVCFTEKKDSLSQWRGYTPLGRGACIEFVAEDVVSYNDAQGFQMVRCIYDYGEKLSIVSETLSILVKEAEKIGPRKNGAKQTFYPAFEMLKPDLLQIAIMFKDEAFADEEEWRAILRVEREEQSKILYRVGKSTLIPYVKYSIVDPKSKRFTFWNVWVGPTPQRDLSVAAMRSMLEGKVRCGRYPVMASRAPYRET